MRFAKANFKYNSSNTRIKREENRKENEEKSDK